MSYRSPYQPRNLHVTHSWGGGLGKWVSEFCRADPYAENLVLRSHGGVAVYGIGLSLADGRHGTTLAHWVLEPPIAATAGAHPHYARRLAEIVRDYRVSHLYVSSLIGHSLDVLATPVATTVVYHDYYPFCIALNPYFDGVCPACPSERLTACHAGNARAYARQTSAAHWLRLRDAYLERLARPELRHVCPTAEVRDHLAALDPRFGALPLHVVPHGLDLGGADCFGGAEESRRLRLVVLGRLKGFEVLREAFGRLQVVADLLLVGAGPWGREFATRTGVTVIEDYGSDDLTSILGRLRPDLALFLNPVPETYSYTLSEAWAHRLPAAAPPVGAYRSRIREGENGFFLGPDPDALVAGVLRLDARRERLREVHAHLCTEPPVRTLAAMVDDYYALRGDYLALAGAILGEP